MALSCIALLLIQVNILSAGSPFGLTTCTEDACPPAATCVQGDGFYSCDCPIGKAGVNCTQDDPCMPREDCPDKQYCFGDCEPNVFCQGATGEAHCRGCVRGYTGMTCMDDVDECTESDNGCLNGATCVNTVGSYTCSCKSGWVGKTCDCKKGSECDTLKDDGTGEASALCLHIYCVFSSITALYLFT